MLNMNLSALVAAFDDNCRSALEEAAGACMGRGGHEIGIEDYFEKLMDQQGMLDVLAQFDINAGRIRELLDKRKQGGGSDGRPVFSPLLIEFLQEAYLLSSLELKQEWIDAGVLALALLSNPMRYSVMPFYSEFGRIEPDALRRLLEGLSTPARGVAQAQSGGPTQGNIDKYATDFTEEAKKGRIDPVFARGPAIRQMVDILTRRRKNNPILVGDPGVGKTAVVEGLALRVSEGNVPDALKGVRVVGLDMGRLQAGASVKGEFEKRLKGVIDEIKASPVPIIMFIDEAHTLVGAGGQAGGSDGANLLKPALARGELRTIAATTWSEYKKYFEKDPALARRFQPVRLDEPSAAETVAILRGIAPHYENTHKVYIRDDALVHTAELSSRYISDRYQPDKAIDVLDTACAKVKVSLGAKPPLLESMEEELASLERELKGIERDSNCKAASGVQGQSGERYGELAVRKAELDAAIQETRFRWEAEKDLVKAIIDLRVQMNRECPDAHMETDADAAEQGDDGQVINFPQAESISTNMERLGQLIKSLNELQGDNPLVFYEVSPSLVAALVSEWTGIPIGKLNLGEGMEVESLGNRLRERIKGQDHAICAIEKAILTSQAGLNSPDAPTAIFLFVGPSGVGKTETALAVADELFGGEHTLISINMSEFQEKHTISRLIGSPPGYVGYGEGGRLTEAVRRQPYSPVLFDEVEKANEDVLNLFYQMFDKGVLADGEGREINFRNTMILLTSNIGSDIVSALCEDNADPDSAILQEALRPVLTGFFRPALLGRMSIVPFKAISKDILKDLVQIKLNKVRERIAARYNMLFECAPELIDSITASCTAVDTGARNIDHIINATLLPGISGVILNSLADKNKNYNRLAVELERETGAFKYILQ